MILDGQEMPVGRLYGASLIARQGCDPESGQRKPLSALGSSISFTSSLVKANCTGNTCSTMFIDMWEATPPFNHPVTADGHEPAPPPAPLDPSIEIYSRPPV